MMVKDKVVINHQKSDREQTMVETLPEINCLLKHVD